MKSYLKSDLRVQIITGTDFGTKEAIGQFLAFSCGLDGHRKLEEAIKARITIFVGEAEAILGAMNSGR